MNETMKNPKPQISVVFVLLASFALTAHARPQSPIRISANQQFSLEAGIGAIAKKVIAPVASSVVSIEFGKARRIALGTIVSSDGQILTKRSNLREGFFVRIGETKFENVTVLGIHKASDLALLKVDAKDLVPVKFEKAFSNGQMLFTPTLDESIALTGTCITGIRHPISKPFLGITMQTSPPSKDQVQSVQVGQVVGDTPAQFFGLFAGDLITTLNGKPVTTLVEFRKVMSGFEIGETIQVDLIRDNQELTKTLELMAESKSRLGFQAFFPSVFLHSSKMIRNKNCGGPIVNSSGDVVGINILGQFRGLDLEQDFFSEAQPDPYSRSVPISSSNLSASVPSEYVLPLIESLSDGSLSPRAVNKDLISWCDHELEKVNKVVRELSTNSAGEDDELSFEDRKRRSKFRVRLKRLTEYRVRLVRGF